MFMATEITEGLAPSPTVAAGRESVGRTFRSPPIISLERQWLLRLGKALTINICGSGMIPWRGGTVEKISDYVDSVMTGEDIFLKEEPFRYARAMRWTSFTRTCWYRRDPGNQEDGDMAQEYGVDGAALRAHADQGVSQRTWPRDREFPGAGNHRRCRVEHLGRHRQAQSSTGLHLTRQARSRHCTTGGMQAAHGRACWFEPTDQWNNIRRPNDRRGLKPIGARGAHQPWLATR